MTVKGMTKKQLIMLLEGNVLEDNVCITEGDMCCMFDNYADTYDSKSNLGDIEFILSHENIYWNDLRPFMPRKGNKLKGFKIIV